MYTTLWPEDRRIPKSGIEQTADGYNIRIFPTEPYFAALSVPHSPALLHALDTCCGLFDMVMSHSLWNPVATFSMRLLRERNIPYAVMAHGMLDPLVLNKDHWKKLLWSILWEKKNVEEAVLVLFNSEAEHAKAQKSGWRFNRSFVLPHPIDLARWATLPPGETFAHKLPQVCARDVILFVGRLNWVKNLDKLVDALRLVRRKRPSAILLCVGPDSNGERRRLQTRAQALGLTDHIFFTGLLEGEDLKAAYACASLLVLVSKKENFGLTVAEALAAGLPVVVSEGVDIASAWESTGPVRRVKPEPETISEAIIDLLQRRDRHGSPDAEARKLAQHEWGHTHITELVELYRQVREERIC